MTRETTKQNKKQQKTYYKKTDIIPIKDLNLTNRFLFNEVFGDKQIQQELLCGLLEKNIEFLTEHETEKELRVSPAIRAVRLDLFSMDSSDIVYNTEMQKEWKADLAKRSRYYQALVDTSLLEPGVPNYNMLNDTYIIMIMPFDLFGYGKYKYTVKAKVEEVPELIFNDRATRIFFNIHGKNDMEVSKELIELLHYLENTTDEFAEHAKSERVKRIHERVRKVKMSEEVGVKYMQAWEERYYDREEARAEGLAEGLAEGRAKGRAEGRYEMLKELISKKFQTGKSIELIAQEVEEDIKTVQSFLDEIQ